VSRSVLGDIGHALSRFTSMSVPVAARRGSASLMTAMRAGSANHLEQLGEVPTLFAVVNGLAEAVSGAEWGMYTRPVSGLVEDRQPVLRHGALDLWTNPNQSMTQAEFVHAFDQHMELVGETDWLIRRDYESGPPAELWPIRPDRLRPDEDPDLFISGWEYTSPDYRTISLPPEDVLQLKLPNPSDPFRGLGPVQALMMDLESSRYGAEWNRNFFTNGAAPGGVLEFDHDLSDIQFKRVQNSWAAGHKGVSNAHRVGIIERGQFRPTTFSMRDMQFTELRKVSGEIIRQAFRYPTAMMGISDNVNRANAEAAEVMLASWLVVPRLKRIRGLLNTRYLRLWGKDQPRRYQFDFTSPVPGDRAADDNERTSKASAFKTLVDSGVHPDDAADAVGLPRMRQKVVVTSPPPAPPAQASLPAGWMIPAGHVHLPMFGPHGAARDTDPAYVAYQQELDALIEQWDQVTAAQRQELAEQVRPIVDSGNLAALATIAVSTAAGTALLIAAMIRLFNAVADLTVADAEAEDITIAAARGREADVQAVATVVCEVMASGLADSAASEALRVRTEASTGEEVSSHVTEYLAALSGAYLVQKLGSALWRAAAGGWAATVRLSGLLVNYRVDETLDANTCPPCREINGTVLKAWDDVVKLGYAHGPYLECQGRDRCRGRIKTIWSV
jgi:HK97 family phage portal protein